LFLKNTLPKSYSKFNWEEELTTVTSAEVYSYIKENNIELTNFINLL